MAVSLRDIYRYFGGHTGGVANDLPFNGPRLADGYVNPEGSSFDQVLTPRGGEGGGGFDESWAIRPESFLANLNAKYGDAVRNPERRSGNDQDRYDLQIDFSKLPKTRFGTVDKTVPYRKGMKLLNPALVYDDPEYGPITIAGNQKSDQPWLGPALMTLVSLGAGGLIGAAGGAGAANNFRSAMAAMRGLQGLGEGNWQSAAAGAAGAFGVPSWATQLARLGMQYRKRSGG